jgi:hypothetical protein
MLQARAEGIRSRHSYLSSESPTRLPASGESCTRRPSAWPHVLRHPGRGAPLPGVGDRETPLRPIWSTGSALVSRRRGGAGVRTPRCRRLPRARSSAQPQSRARRAGDPDLTAAGCSRCRLPATTGSRSSPPFRSQADASRRPDRCHRAVLVYRPRLEVAQLPVFEGGRERRASGCRRSSRRTARHCVGFIGASVQAHGPSRGAARRLLPAGAAAATIVPLWCPDTDVTAAPATVDPTAGFNPQSGAATARSGNDNKRRAGVTSSVALARAVAPPLMGG